MIFYFLASLIFVSSVSAHGSESKMTFKQFWKSRSICNEIKDWKPISKLAKFEFPETKHTPLVWQSTLESDPLIFAAEPSSHKAAAFSNAWMLWDGRQNWVKLPLEKGTSSEDLKKITICIYPDGHFFDMTVPDTDYQGANPRDCELKVLYQFNDPDFKFIAKRCN